MMDIRLIAIDLDGTFLTRDKQIPPANIEALQRAIARGAQVVICTGRTLPGVRRFLAQLPFFQQGDYLILQNGAATHRFPDLQLVDQVVVSKKAKQLALEVLENFRHQGVQLVAFDQDNLFLIDESTPSKYVVSDAATLETPITPMTAEDFLTSQALNKVMFLATEGVLNDVEASLSTVVHQTVNVVRSQPVIVEFLPKGVNKRYGLERLANQLCIGADQVMAIGDQMNDLEMLEYAGVAVAMGNAVPDIIESADFVTKSNDDAGVAYAIEQIILHRTELLL